MKEALTAFLTSFGTSGILVHSFQPRFSGGIEASMSLGMDVPKQNKFLAHAACFSYLENLFSSTKRGKT